MTANRSTILVMRGRTEGVPRLIWALILVLLVASSPAKAQETQSGSGRAPETTFAFSDFDGDRRPDFAVVEPGQSDRSFTDYWVQLRLTTAGMQSIRVVGPTGGLQVAARDVNGDDVPDLVLTTLWRNQPVAILLNDGSGSFSRVDPNVFPSAFSPFETSWSSPGSQEETLLAVFTQYRAGLVPVTSRVLRLRSGARFLPRGELFAWRSSESPTDFGRAPPADPRV